jgi:hypothetical protein
MNCEGRYRNDYRPDRKMVVGVGDATGWFNNRKCPTPLENEQGHRMLIARQFNATAADRLAKE